MRAKLISLAMSASLIAYYVGSIADRLSMGDGPRGGW